MENSAALEGSDLDWFFCAIYRNENDKFSSNTESALAPMVGLCGHSFARANLEAYFKSKKNRNKKLPCIYNCCTQRKCRQTGEMKPKRIAAFIREEFHPNYSLCRAVKDIGRLKKRLKKARNERERQKVLREAPLKAKFHKCPICHGEYSTEGQHDGTNPPAPIVGSCGHTFCLKCCSDAHAEAIRQSRSRRLKNFACPQCHTEKAFNCSSYWENIGLRSALRFWHGLREGKIDVLQGEEEGESNDDATTQRQATTTKSRRTTTKTTTTTNRKKAAAASKAAPRIRIRIKREEPCSEWKIQQAPPTNNNNNQNQPNLQVIKIEDTEDAVVPPPQTNTLGGSVIHVDIDDDDNLSYADDDDDDEYDAELQWDPSNAAQGESQSFVKEEVLDDATTAEQVPDADEDGGDNATLGGGGRTQQSTHTDSDSAAGSWEQGSTHEEMELEQRSHQGAAKPVLNDNEDNGVIQIDDSSDEESVSGGGDNQHASGSRSNQGQSHDVSDVAEDSEKENVAAVKKEEAMNGTENQGANASPLYAFDPQHQNEEMLRLLGRLQKEGKLQFLCWDEFKLPMEWHLYDDSKTLITVMPDFYLEQTMSRLYNNMVSKSKSSNFERLKYDQRPKRWLVESIKEEERVVDETFVRSAFVSEFISKAQEKVSEWMDIKPWCRVLPPIDVNYAESISEGKVQFPLVDSNKDWKLLCAFASAVDEFGLPGAEQMYQAMRTNPNDEHVNQIKRLESAIEEFLPDYCLWPGDKSFYRNGTSSVEISRHHPPMVICPKLAKPGWTSLLVVYNDLIFEPISGYKLKATTDSFGACCGCVGNFAGISKSWLLVEKRDVPETATRKRQREPSPLDVNDAGRQSRNRASNHYKRSPTGNAQQGEPRRETFHNSAYSRSACLVDSNGGSGDYWRGNRRDDQSQAGHGRGASHSSALGGRHSHQGSHGRDEHFGRGDRYHHRQGVARSNGAFRNFHDQQPNGRHGGSGGSSVSSTTSSHNSGRRLQARHGKSGGSSVCSTTSSHSDRQRTQGLYGVSGGSSVSYSSTTSSRNNDRRQQTGYGSIDHRGNDQGRSSGSFRNGPPRGNPRYY